MFAKVHKPVNTPGVINNKSSCITLAEYLQKENESEPDENKTAFFNTKYDSCASTTVINNIDKNVQKLTKRDDKFYMLSLNPSHREAQNLIKNVTGKSVENFDQLNSEEKQLVFEELRNYTRNSMDLYAQNFNRENIKSGDDLVYYAKIETQRKYHHYDKDVKEGKAKNGDYKSGLNLHMHIIVSRKDITGKIKLSPLAKSKGNTWELNGKQVNRGFNHLKWKNECNEMFWNNYKYTEKYSSSFQIRINENNINIGTRSLNPIQSKIKGKVKNELLQGNFGDERNIISKVNTTINLVSNPKQVFANTLKRKVKDILLGNENTL